MTADTPSRTYAHRFKRLPVVDTDGKLVGIVSRKDLFAVFLRKAEDIRDGITATTSSHSAWAW